MTGEMTEQPYKISVVVCAYAEDRLDDLVAAVRSLQHQTLPPFEVIVVVDHNDELLDRVAGSILGIRVLANRKVPGASAARNTGVAEAAGDIVAFLDDDAEAGPRLARASH